MPKVKIYQTSSDGSQTTIAECFLNHNQVDCQGDNNFVTHLKEVGIRDYSENTEENLLPKDGLKFLEQLKYNFKSGYLNASDVME